MRGQHYDLILNGVEVGGGSVRVHDADMQEYIFEKVLRVRFLLLELDKVFLLPFWSLQLFFLCDLLHLGGIFSGSFDTAFDRCFEISYWIPPLRACVAPLRIPEACDFGFGIRTPHRSPGDLNAPDLLSTCKGAVFLHLSIIKGGGQTMLLIFGFGASLGHS